MAVSLGSLGLGEGFDGLLRRGDVWGSSNKKVMDKNSWLAKEACARLHVQNLV